MLIIDRNGNRTDYADEPLLKKTKTVLNLQGKKKEKEENDNVSKDFFYFFQPPKPFGDITHGIAMVESMHMNTLNYLLPALKSDPCPIGARHMCGGAMFCVSFHVMSKDEIKCYLYIDQKCTKIVLKQNAPMNELKLILSQYFEDDSIESISVEGIVQKLKKMKFTTNEIEQFEECLMKIGLNVYDIERDISSHFTASKIVTYLRKECKWSPPRSEELYFELRDFFGFRLIAKDEQESAVKITRTTLLKNHSTFSTVDRKCEKMKKKLGVF